jgi:cell division protein ZapA
VTVDATVGCMSGAPVELRVGGQTYRVVASADEQELRRLASIVDTKLRELTAPGRQISPQALLLAALALAHDLEEERERRVAVENRWREKLTSMLQRIDAALDATTVVEPRAEAEAPSHDS